MVNKVRDYYLGGLGINLKPNGLTNDIGYLPFNLA
jgi:hypothetical protein